MAEETDFSWGGYYANSARQVINVDELDKAKTLALYLYGRMTMPQDPADRIRSADAPQIVAKINGQKFFETIGEIIPSVNEAGAAGRFGMLCVALARAAS